MRPTTHCAFPGTFYARPMRIQLNGEDREVAESTTIAGLLAELGFEGKPVAVERNTLIIPRADHASTQLGDGDALEVVQFVGGG